VTGHRLGPARWLRRLTRRQPTAWLLAVRDLQLRRRRFAIAVLSASLVLSLTLLQSGVSASFDNEVHRMVRSFGADAWLVRAGSLGPFTAPTTFPATWVDEVRQLPGVKAADPVAVASTTTSTPRVRPLYVTGVVPGGLGFLSTDAGLLGHNRAVVDARLGLHPGDRVVLNGHWFTVSGLTHGRTVFAGWATGIVSLPDLQRTALDGLPLATAILIRGVPSRVPKRFTLLTNAEVRADLIKPVASAKQTISLIRSLLWLVAGAIIGALIYLSALERLPQFAVLKAVGVGTRSLVASLLLEAIVAALAAAALAFGFERLIAPAAAMSVEVPWTSYVLLPLVAIAIGVLASLAALRKAISVDPALAFAAAR
jgi:putative ABC transport system permease protein